MNLCWATDYWNVGNSFGYSYFNKMFKNEMSKYFTLEDSAEISVSMMPADKFKYIPDKFNILFTMWEAGELPKDYIEKLSEADLVIVPCRFCKDLFKKYVTTPIEVCHGAVDGQTFFYKKREFNRSFDRFRLLWLGAPNPRKGWEIVATIADAMDKFKNMEFYLKTTVPEVSKEDNKVIIDKYEKKLENKTLKPVLREAMEKRLEKIKTGNINDLYDQVITKGRNKNVIIDTRILETKELVDLYHSAHAFILPSVGEGWGLTLCEAMSTGCPSIAPVHTGMAEFFDESVGYTVSWKELEIRLRDYDITPKVKFPNIDECMLQVANIYNNYSHALRKAHKARMRMEKKFTWSKSGKRLASIIKSHMLKEVA